MSITPGRYRPIDDHTVECVDCTADSGGQTAIIPETAIHRHEEWHAGPPEKGLLRPLSGPWPEMPPEHPVAPRASEGPEVTRIPELSDEQLHAWAEEMWVTRPQSWPTPAVPHDEWVERFVTIGRMLSGKEIKG